jgi:heptaprenyl diphosphate synthase
LNRGAQPFLNKSGSLPGKETNKMDAVSKRISTKKMAVIAMLVAQAAVLHYLEGLFPNPVPIPGVKLGLANIITLVALVVFDFRTAMQITVLRTILGSLLAGTLFGMGFFMSFAGAVTSTIVMALVLRSFKMLGMVGISILGPLLTISDTDDGDPGAAFPRDLPVSAGDADFSIPTGILTGLLINELVKYLQATDRIHTLLDD